MAGRLLRSGLFDEEYYAAAAGEIFPTPLVAAEHCVKVGLSRRLSPNPLLEAAYLPARVQASWAEGKIGPTLAYLRSDRGRESMLGPLFDAGQVPEPDGGFGRGGALSCFLASATEGTRLPLPENYSGSVLTYGEARRQLLTGVIAKRLAKSGVASMSEPYAVRRAMNRRARAAVWPPALRWGIKLPSTLGPIGDLWGDTHYGESLAAALRALGQEVTVYRNGVHDSPLSFLDDVVVAIRGLRPIAPVPGCLNIVWVISHPEDVSPAELHGFDLVFGASTPWCQRMTDLLGREVHPLLQATDTRRRPDTSVLPGDGSEAVFVGGNQQGRHRTIVHDAMTAGCSWSALSIFDAATR